MEQGLKVAVLKAAAMAIEAEPIRENTDLDKLGDRASRAWYAVSNEEQKAKALRQRFYAEYSEAEQADGICNARDTAADYGLYAKHGDLVELSSEFWQCAIDSAQLMRDFA